MTQELAYSAPAARVPVESSVTRRFLVRLARGAAAALVIQILGAGLGYLSQVAFARWMGVEQFGVYSYVIAWTTILALLSGLGFPLSVLRFIPEYRSRGEHDRIRGLVRVSRAAVLGAGLAVAVLATAGAFLFSSEETARTVALASWLVPLGALINLDLAIIRAGGRVVAAYGPSFVVRPALILGASGVVWITARHLGADTGLAVTLGVFLAVALIQTFYVREVVRTDGSPRSPLYEPRRWVGVSAPLLLVAGFQIALSQTDILIVGGVQGVRYAGLYLAASKTAALVGYLLVALNAVAAPLFSELEARGDRAGLQRLATVSAQWVFWPTLAIAIGLAVLAPYILELFGSEFVAARGALLILLLGQLFSSGCGAVGYLLSMTGHQNDMARVYGIVALFNVAVCYAGVRLFGLNGGAWATTISLVVWNVWLHHLTVKRIGVRASILASISLRRKERSGRGGR